MPLGGVYMGAGESHLAEASACLLPCRLPELSCRGQQKGLVRTLPDWHAPPFRCPTAFLVLEK